MADFNFYMNRQGIQGVQGEKGDQGYSPTVEVVTNTAAEYILKITTEDNEFYTPNLRGSAVEDLGGTYMRYDPDTQQMFAGPPDYAAEDEWGVVQLATDDDITGASTTKVVTAERITDINATLAEHESTMTTMQTEIDAISEDIPTVNDGVLTVTQGTTPLGSFTANSSTDVTINIPVPTTPNNGTLTIQKNGTTIGTFDADSSTNVTANITVPTQLSDLSDGSTVVTQTTLETTLQDYVETTTLATVATSGNYNDLSNKPTIPASVTITTTLTSQSTNEEVPGAKATYDWLNELTTTQTNQETRLSTIEDEYFDKRTDLKSSITSTDTTGAPTPAAVYDFVTTEISHVTVDKATTTTLGTVMPDNNTITIDSNGVISSISSAPTNMVTTDTDQTIPGLKTFGSGDHNSLFTPNASVRFADGNYRRVDELKIATSNTLGYSNQASYTQVTLDAVGGSGSTRTYGRVGVAPYSSGQLIAEVQSTGGYGRLTMTPTGLTYNANGTSYNILNPSINVATSSSVGTVKPDGTTTEVDANGTLSTVNMVQSTSVNQIVQLTQAAYDALTTPDPNTFYVIIG